jgi:hypothetical protein
MGSLIGTLRLSEMGGGDDVNRSKLELNLYNQYLDVTGEGALNPGRDCAGLWPVYSAMLNRLWTDLAGPCVEALRG